MGKEFFKKQRYNNMSWLLRGTPRKTSGHPFSGTGCVSVRYYGVGALPPVLFRLSLPSALALETPYPLFLYQNHVQCLFPLVQTGDLLHTAYAAQSPPLRDDGGSRRHSPIFRGSSDVYGSIFTHMYTTLCSGEYTSRELVTCWTCGCVPLGQ